MNPTLGTEIIKQGGRTVFVDVRRAKNEAVYINIATLGKSQDGTAERHVVTLFGLQVVELCTVLKKIVKEHNKELTAVHEPASLQS